MTRRPRPRRSRVRSAARAGAHAGTARADAGASAEGEHAAASESRREALLAGAEESVSRALDAALNFLSYRPRTGYEVRRKLVSRGFGPETVEAAMHRLSAVGLVDDAAFVSAYVRDRVAHRPTGVRRLLDELYTKGVPHEAAAPLIEAALHEEGTDERALARRVAERKCQSAAARRQDPRVLRRQVRDHLARRGFNLRIIHEVLDELVPRSARNADEA